MECVKVYEQCDDEYTFNKSPIETYKINQRYVIIRLSSIVPNVLNHQGILGRNDAQFPVLIPM
jgi:hypothetical protein